MELLIKRLNYVDVQERNILDKPLWWHLKGLSYTASGYGAKIPSSKMALIDGRKYRIYYTICSNAGSIWVKIKGKKYFVNEIRSTK